MLAQEVWPGGSQDVAQHKRDDDRVVELASHGDEVWHQVDWHREVGDQRDEQQLGPPWDAIIGEQPANQHQTVGDKAGQGARA